MDVNTSWSGVKSYEILLKFTDSTNSAFQNFLNEHSLLWVDHLIITLFEFSKYFDIFNVEASQMMEHIVNRPGRDVLNTILVEL